MGNPRYAAHCIVDCKTVFKSIFPGNDRDHDYGAGKFSASNECGAGAIQRYSILFAPGQDRIGQKDLRD